MLALLVGRRISVAVLVMLAIGTAPSDSIAGTLVPLDPSKLRLAPPPGTFSLLIPLHHDADHFFTSRVGDLLLKRHFFGDMIDVLNASLLLKRNVNITVKACMKANAFYDPATSSITLCEELFGDIERLFSGLGPGPQFDEAVLGATSFVVLHEVGHALVHQFSMPVLGGEEDAADAIATVIAVSAGVSRVALAGADSFAFMAARRRKDAPRTFWDVHSLDEQRFYHIACWVYGSQPGNYGFLVEKGFLPTQLAAQCANAYHQKVDAVMQTLGPHMRRGPNE